MAWDYYQFLYKSIRCLLAVLVLAWAATVGGLYASAHAESPDVVPRVNVPFFEDKSDLTQGAIFWFGRVTPRDNYADVRVAYTSEALTVDAHIIDRRLWYSAKPLSHELTEWDAVTLLLHLDDTREGDVPSPASYRFTAQLNHAQLRQNYQTVAQGTPKGWVASSIPFTTTTGWRGKGLNEDQDDRGWNATFHIPFSSMDLASAPTPGDVWRAALIIHDRDDAAGTKIPEQIWPKGLESQHPSTWGRLAFGVPASDPPPSVQIQETTVIRQGLGGMSVVDAHVGGHSTCGQNFWPQFFDGWGDANYAGYDQINIQNQWDIADWPCFSKYYITFPTASLSPGKKIISATLTMHLFGNAGYEPGQAKSSLVQVATVADDWSEADLTWNNAPMALENVAATWVEPVGSFAGAPGVPVHWDVSRAMADSYASGLPLRLVLYSPDGAYNSGKYFSSSDTADWNAEGRPTLSIVWRDSADSGEPEAPEEPGESEAPPSSSDLYLPMLVGSETSRASN